VGFLPPGNTLVRDYRVSVQIDFSSAPQACIGIHTRFSGTGYYENAICADGTWVLWRVSDKFTALASGQVALARTYTLGAASDGPKQSLTISGTEKASVTDGTLTTGDIQLEVSNDDISTRSVVLSDFSYTPLPNSTAIATPASSAVLAFKDPLTSPGRWQNQPVGVHGITCQFVQGGYQVKVAQKGWIGNCGGVGHQDFSNFVFEVHMRIVAGDCGGIVFRKANNSAGYYFQVCRNGAYNLALVTRSGQSILIAKGISPFIASGLQAENLISVVANGTRLDFYANHQLIYGTNDSTYSHGLMDISAATVDSTLTQVVYWDASVWTL
jgi:hypothetical protein